MAEFERTESKGLYVEESSIIPIVIKFNDANIKWHNERSKIKFEEAIKDYEGIKSCFFVASGISKGLSSRPQVNIFFENSSLSIRLSIDNGERSFTGPTLLEEVFVIPNDSNEYIHARCNLRFISSGTDIIDAISEMSWGQRLQEIKNFVVNVSVLPRPLKEIRKEEDQAIWKAYSDGMDALTKAKQELQKIRKVGEIRTQTDRDKRKIKCLELEIEALNYQEILRNHLLEEFQDHPIAPEFISEKKGKICHLIFNDFRQFTEDDLLNLNSIAEQTVYRIKNTEAPKYKFDGRFKLKGTHGDNQNVLSDFEQVLKNYDDSYPSKIDNVYSFKTDVDRDFALEQIKQRFGSVLKASPATNLVCSFSKKMRPDIVDIIKEEIGIESVKIHDNFLVIETRKEINVSDIQKHGLTFDSCRCKLKTTKFEPNIKVPASLTIKGGYYQSVIADSTQVESRLNGWTFALRNAYRKQGVSIGCQVEEITYIFRSVDDKESLKTLARNLGNENNIIIKTALGKAFFSPESFIDYELVKEKISISLNDDLNFNFSFDEYVPKLKISFLNEEADYAHNNFINIQNSLRNFDIDWKEIEDSLLFSFEFDDEEKRDLIKSALGDIYKNLQQILSLEIVNSTGQTIISFTEDHVLKIERDKEIQKDFERQSVNLVPAKFDKILSEINHANDNGDWETKKKLQGDKRELLSNAIQIGTCVKRTELIVTVRITEEFLYKLEDNEVSIKAGDYIQFPLIGEATNVLRQKEAIDRILRPGMRNQYNKATPQAVNPNISNFLFDPRYAREIEGDIEEVKAKIRERQIESNMNDRQCEAVAKAIESKDIAFIQGPPGTGKTTVIAEIIWQEVIRNPSCKILLTSQTNLAVDNALERLQGKRGIRPVRVTNASGEIRIGIEGKRYLLGQIENWRDKPDEDNIDNAANNWIELIIDEIDSSGKYSNVLSQWKKDLTQRDDFVRNTFTDAYTRNVNLIAATCSICGAKSFNLVYKALFGDNSEINFDVVIMDEASKATPLEMAIPMVLGKKIIVIGDHKQLPPMVNDDEVKDALRKIGRNDLVDKLESIKESQFKRLFEASQKMRKTLVATLDTQYRMHEQIMNCISHFYKDDILGGLKCGIVENMNSEDFSNRASRHHGLSNPPFINPNVHAIWVDVDGREEKVGTSSINKAELAAIEKVLNNLRESQGYAEYLKNCGKPEEREIGIITFYGAQAKGIIEMNKQGKLGEGDFRIDVVDKFQGMERNIVIVSTVRTASMGFARDIERINVAFSRAKRLLIVVGDKDFFGKNLNYRASISAMEIVDLKQLD